jgi:hypothetical protein
MVSVPENSAQDKLDMLFPIWKIIGQCIVDGVYPI